MTGPLKNHYNVGQIVRHKHYSYRGVIVEWNPVCRADDAWYHKSKDQPSREQPWYHIIVDGGGTTYVAQQYLELSHDHKAIENPFIEHCFTTFVEGRYYKHSIN